MGYRAESTATAERRGDESLLGPQCVQHSQTRTSGRSRRSGRVFRIGTKKMKQKPPNPDTPAALIETPGGYADWLADLKLRIHTAQQRALLVVNRELVLLYWQIGRDILERQSAQGWGAKVIG